MVTTPFAARVQGPLREYYLENIDSSGVVRIPVTLPSLCVRRGRRVAEVSAIASDLAGLIVLLSCVASKRTVDVLNSTVAKINDGRLLISLFVDYTDSGMTIEGIEQCLAGLGVVEKISVNGEIAKGVAFNNHLFPLLIGDKRAVAFEVEHYRAMLDLLRERLGEAANALLYDLGHRYGRSFAGQVRSETRLSDNELVKVALAEVQAAGWCVVSGFLMDADKLAWKVSVRQLFECSQRKTDGMGGRSHFFRGFIAGLFSEAFELDNVSCVETLCSSNSANVCEFAAWV